jgi:Glycosyltransferase 61
LKTADAAARHRFTYLDHPYLRELQGQRLPLSLDNMLRKGLALRAGEEREALIYYRSLPAPAHLDTEDPFVDDELLAAAIRIRAGKPRWEAAWHLRGDIRVALGTHPLVFFNNRFVPGSVGFSEGPPLPILQNYARRLMGRPTVHVDRALLLRDSWDHNYWHLLQDILPRLIMAEAIDIDPAIPIVVSETLMKCHGNRLSGTPFLKERPVIVQPEGHTLCCREVFLLRPAPLARHWTPGVMARIPAEPGVAFGSRYIYCRREPESSWGRTAENSLEIEEIFRSAGFAVIDPAPMTLNRQKAIFQHAEVIAGINGAAFANALFRDGKPLTIGALISSNWMSTTFPTMAKVFGFSYAGFVVAPIADGVTASILVPPDTVRRLIERVLDRAARG